METIGGDREADGGVRIELVLYISSASADSLRARRNLETLLERFEAAQVRLAIVDLSRGHSEDAQRDRIALTPTLVRRQPQPAVSILGSLDNSQALADLLSAAGVDRKP